MGFPQRVDTHWDGGWGRWAGVGVGVGTADKRDGTHIYGFSLMSRCPLGWRVRDAGWVGGALLTVGMERVFMGFP